MNVLKHVLVFVLVFVVSSCSKDEEESSYSMMTAEFCMLQTSTAKTASMAKTDNDVTLSFNSPLTVSWATKADSTYRALLYYNKVENSTSVEAVSAHIVYVLYPYAPKDAEKWSNEHDPLDIASAWRSSNGKWLNLNLSIKTGTTDGDDKSSHSIGLVCDSIVATQSGRLMYYSLCHGQNNIPTYYTVTAYASIPIENPTDSIVLNVTTWNGKAIRQY